MISNSASPAANSKVPIDCLSVTDANDINDQVPVADGIQDPIASLPNSIALLTGQLLHPSGPRVVGQRLDALDDPPAIRLGRYGFEVLERGFLDAKAIACHAA
jgi:hypothetical protein